MEFTNLSPKGSVQLVCRTDMNPILQFGISFGIGVLFSPWSSGLFYLLVGILVYEIILALLLASYSYPYPAFTRAGVIASSLLGYLVGRELFQHDILEEGW